MRSDRQKLINEQTYKMKREEKSFTTKREGEKNPSFLSVCVVCIHLLAKTIYLKKKNYETILLTNSLRNKKHSGSAGCQLEDL